jgi:hypothetical protein
MTRRRAIGFVLVTLGIASIALGLTTPAAHADAPDKTAWWFELQQSGLPLPLPVPTVPEGGIYVQQGPTEPTAYGALHYLVAEGTESSLVLTAAAGSTTQVASLQACVTITAWEAPAASPAPWDARPEYDTPCAPGIVSSDSKFVAFHLDPSFLVGGDLNVAIVPDPKAPPFAIAFEKPGGDSLEIESVTPPFVDEPTTEPSFEPFPVDTTPAFDVPPVSDGGVNLGPPPTTVATPAPRNRPTPTQRVLRVVGLGDVDRGQRAFALGGASAIVVGWWLAASRTAPSPRLLGALSGGGDAVIDRPRVRATRVAGIGRFERSRADKPRSLR